MELKPIHDKIIIKPIKREQKTQSGIILASTEGQSHLLRNLHDNMGEVLAINDKEKDIKVGDVVLYSRWGAEVFEDFIILSSKDIILNIEEVE